MLCVRGLDSKSYWKLLAAGKSLPDVECPNPTCRGCLLRGHGWYWRRLDGQLKRVRRLRCPRCRRTHALLPEDVCAYRDLRLSEVEHALEESPSPSWQTPVLFLLPGTIGSFWDRVRAVVGQDDGKLIRLRHWVWSICRYFLSGLSGLFRQGQPNRIPRGRSTDPTDSLSEGVAPA